MELNKVLNRQLAIDYCCAVNDVLEALGYDIELRYVKTEDTE